MSYKDATHRLYMAEVERLKTEKQAEHAITAVRDRVDNTVVNDIFPALTKIDSVDVEAGEASASASST